MGSFCWRTQSGSSGWSEEKADNLLKKFMDENKSKGWEDSFWNWVGSFHGKSFKNDIITMSFWAGKTVEFKTRGKDGFVDSRACKAPILTSRWTETGDLIDWNVEIKDVKTRY